MGKLEQEKWNGRIVYMQHVRSADVTYVEDKFSYPNPEGIGNAGLETKPMQEIIQAGEMKQVHELIS